jgi:hypothetical protein
MQFIDVTGERYGKLVVIARAPKSTRSGNVRWICRCDCGNEYVVTSNHLRRKKDPVRSCGCARTRGPGSPLWGGYGEISGDFWYSIQRGADGRKHGENKLKKMKTWRGPVAFELTIEQAWELFLQQERRCNLTGLPLVMYDADDSTARSASLDRIDPKGGYVLGNVQWVHKMVNIMKNKFPQDEFIEMCRRVASHQDRYDEA